jgi:hypothetical protein
MKVSGMSVDNPIQGAPIEVAPIEGAARERRARSNRDQFVLSLIFAAFTIGHHFSISAF